MGKGFGSSVGVDNVGFKLGCNCKAVKALDQSFLEAHDALGKGSKVVLALVETLGGVSPPLARQYRRLARRTRGKYAVDRTQYGRTRASPTSYLTHHTQLLVKAVVMADAKAIGVQLTLLKRQVAAKTASRGA